VGVVALLGPFVDTIVICTMTGLVIITTGSWESHHPANLDLNHPEVTYVAGDREVTRNMVSVDETPVVITIEDGIPADGFFRYYGVDVDTIYADHTRIALFNGSITIFDGEALARDADDNVYTHLNTGVIQNGAPLTAAAFEVGLSPLFPGGGLLVTFSVLLFAVSTSISWSYYGERSIHYLFGDRSIFYYRMMYVTMHFIGAVLTLGVVWTFGDIMLGLMTFPNLIGLFALSGVVYKATKKYFDTYPT